MRTRPAAATNPLRCQESFLAKQPQHPLATDLHAVLTTEPGPNLAVALTSNRQATRTRRISSTRSGSLIEVAGPGRAGIVAWRRA
jgi:hypothetical protein